MAPGITLTKSICTKTPYPVHFLNKSPGMNRGKMRLQREWSEEGENISAHQELYKETGPIFF
jgi:hypothetical protein